jgi:hypothetical protein
MIGNEAFSGNLEEIAARASMDVMAYNQKACISSLVHYVEGTEEHGTVCRISATGSRKMG